MISKHSAKRSLAGLATVLVTVLTTVLAMALPVPAMATTGQQQITVTYNNITVTLNGQPLSLKDAVGNTVYPLNYNGTVYLPVRAVSQALGLTVSWNSASDTVALTGSVSGGSSGGSPPSGSPPSGSPPSGSPPSGSPPSGTQPTGTPPTGTPPSGTPPAGTTGKTSTAGKAMQKEITVTYANIKVTLNGKQLSLKDAKGNAVEPFNYNGTVYLPVRAIAEALGISVSYDAATSTVILGGGGPGGPGGPGGSGGTTTTEGTAAYDQKGGTQTKSNQTITAAQTNESGVKVESGGTLVLSDSTVTTSGNTSSDDGSSFYGLNAAVLAESASKITLSGSTITTSGTGANGAFARGSGASVTLSDDKIKCGADGAHGVDATQGGTLTLNNVDITTAGAHGAAVATDRGGGTITVTGGTMTTSGDGSPGIYSTGDITVSGADMTATGSEAAVIEGKNSISLTNTTLSGAKKWGVMVYQSFSGDAGIGKGIFTMNGGSLTAAVGPLFYSTNTTAEINLKNAKLTAASGVLLDASAGSWGTQGSNGATVAFNAAEETLNGNITVDSISSVAASLTDGTTLTGSINTDGKARSMTLALDKTSTWDVTGTSYLTGLTDDDTALANIHDAGCTVYYDASAAADSWLGGKTYTLTGGGTLTPLTSTSAQ